MEDGRRGTIAVPDLPRSVEAERAVLAAILLDPSILRSLDLRGGHFSTAAHAEIWASMVELDFEGQVVDPLTLTDMLGKKGKLGLVGGLAYIAALDGDLPDIGRVEAYREILEERRCLREAQALAQRVYLETGRTERAASELIEEAASRMRAILSGSARGTWKAMDDAVADYVQAALKREYGEIAGVSTGLLDLDKILGGMRGGQLVILAARPGMGKTSLALQMAEHQAEQQGLTVGILSLEMSSSELAGRITARRSGIPTQAMNAGLSQAKRDELRRGMRGVSAGQLYVDDRGHATATQIAVAARQLAGKGLRTLFIDQLTQTAPDRRVAGNRNAELEEVTSSLKALAKELDITVVALSQLSRAGEYRGKGDKRPQLHELRDSGSLEQTADAVLFVYRQEYYEPFNLEAKGRAEVIVAKNRDGRTGTVHLHWDGATTTFTNAAWKRHQEEERTWP